MCNICLRHLCNIFDIIYAYFFILLYIFIDLDVIPHGNSRFVPLSCCISCILLNAPKKDNILI